MLTIPRSAARRLRILARKSINGRPRGQAPSMLAIPAEQGITLAVALEEAFVTLRIPGPTKLKTQMLLPMALLDAVAATPGITLISNFLAGRQARQHVALARQLDEAQARRKDAEA